MILLNYKLEGQTGRRRSEARPNRLEGLTLEEKNMKRKTRVWLRKRRHI
jgi:hypothetical protein